MFSQDFGYDKNSNRLQLTDNGVVTDYFYEVGSNRLSQAGASSYVRDANGNTLNDGLHDYVYNPHNRLVGVDGSSAYDYNALGQRTKKAIFTVGYMETNFVYGLNGQLLREYNPVIAMDQEFIYLGDIPVAVVAQDKVYYLHTDHLGTPREVSDSDSNTIVWRWDSDPFGATAANEDPDGDGNAFTFNLRFPGQYYDSETGLHYNYFRYYDPKTGRYITSDPIGLDGGLNTYGYVGGNPVNAIDPTGEVAIVVAIPWIVGGSGSGGILTGLSWGAVIGTGAWGLSNIGDSSNTNSDEECDDEKKKKNCQALKDSILNTCYGLSPKKRMKCFEAANTAYRQCMGYE